MWVFIVETQNFASLPSLLIIPFYFVNRTYENDFAFSVSPVSNRLHAPHIFPPGLIEPPSGGPQPAAPA